MGAKASYLLVCDPAPAGLGLRTEVDLLLINDVSSTANDFRVSDNPNVFLNKSGLDIGPLTTELIKVSADVLLEGKRYQKLSAIPLYRRYSVCWCSR